MYHHIERTVLRRTISAVILLYHISMQRMLSNDVTEDEMRSIKWAGELYYQRSKWLNAKC